MATAGPRRRKLIGHRRRVEDDGEEEAGPETPRGRRRLSLTEGSIGSDDDDAADDSDTSNVDESSPTAPNARKAAGNGAAKPGQRGKHAAIVPGGNDASAPAKAAITDTEIMLNGLTIDSQAAPPQDINFDDMQVSPAKESAPIIVSSSSAPRAPLHERRRREHEEYRRKRTRIPRSCRIAVLSLCMTIGTQGLPRMAFDRLLEAGVEEGEGEEASGPCLLPSSTGSLTISFAPLHMIFTDLLSSSTQFPPAFQDPTTNAPWTHDKHDTVADHPPHRPARAHLPDREGPPNGTGIIPYAKPSQEPINRAMSTEKHLGNATVRVVLPALKANAVFTGVPLKQYTKLPDHRPLCVGTSLCGSRCRTTTPNDASIHISRERSLVHLHTPRPPAERATTHAWQGSTLYAGLNRRVLSEDQRIRRQLLWECLLAEHRAEPAFLHRPRYGHWTGHADLAHRIGHLATSSPHG